MSGRLECLGGGDHCFLRDAQFLHHHVARSGEAEGVGADGLAGGADIAAPRDRHAGFDADALRAGGGQDFFLVGLRLAREDFHRRHRDHADAGAEKLDPVEAERLFAAARARAIPQAALAIPLTLLILVEIGSVSGAELASRTLPTRAGYINFRGPAGSVVFFDCNTMHGSNGNITPSARSNLFYVYNHVDNAVKSRFAAARRALAARKPIDRPSRAPARDRAADSTARQSSSKAMAEGSSVGSNIS